MTHYFYLQKTSTTFLLSKIAYLILKTLQLIKDIFELKKVALKKLHKIQ